MSWFGAEPSIESSASGGNVLMQIYNADDILPGSPPSYETCKTIYSYHPLGARMVDKPITMAQSMPRELHVTDGPEDELVEQFRKTWRVLGGVGAERLIANALRIARIYGIGSVGVGCRNVDPAEPLNLDRVSASDLYFNMLDPLNTSGSLVLDQDPNSPGFMKPRDVRVGPQTWHPSRTVVVMNEEPVYIEWTNSAFGFVGRSVFQRALYPLKSFIASMVTDDLIVQKAGLLVANLKSPSSIVDRISLNFLNQKRQSINTAKTGNVLSLGLTEKLESLQFTGLKESAEFARNDILKNIATASNMPAQLLNQETLAEGFGEGSEDAKQIARYIDSIRVDMGPLYDFFDRLVMHVAWTREFYASIRDRFEEYANVDYTDAFYRWQNSFRAEWPNLLVEPDSKLVERDAKIMESAIGLAETILPVLDPHNKAQLATWLADVYNSRTMLASEDLEIDPDSLEAYAQEHANDPPPSEPETNATFDV